MGVSKDKRELAGLEEPEHSWERQHNETDSAWDAFVVYRDLGPAKRSLAEVGRVQGKHRRNYFDWSSDWSWVRRCADYDAWMDRQTKLAEIEAIRDMKRRHVELALELQEAAKLGLKKLIETQKAIAGDPEAEPLNPKGIKELAELGAKLERLSRGEPDAIEVARIETAPAHDYSRLSVEELRALLELTRKASAEDEANDE